MTKEQIKNIIESYCEGINHLEFNIADLDKMADEILALQLQQTGVMQRYFHPFVGAGTLIKETEKSLVIKLDFNGKEYFAPKHEFTELPLKTRKTLNYRLMSIDTKQPIEQAESGNLVKPMLANRLFKFRFWGNFGELNEEEDICEMEMLYGDKFCFFESEPINDLFACRNFQVMQFTGLKDKNGKEIYEGDILEYVSFRRDENKRREIVEFDEKCGGWYVHKQADALCNVLFEQHDEEWQKKQNFKPSPKHKVRVIGNIYENPELLQTTS